MEKEVYVKPLIEIIEFNLDDEIATNDMSMNFGAGAICTEEIK